MIFYRISVRYIRHEDDALAELKNRLRARADEISERDGGGVFVFVEEAYALSCGIGAAVKPESCAGFSAKQLIGELSAAADTELCLRHCEEIGLSRFKNSLKFAENGGFIDSSSEIITRLELDFDCAHREFTAAQMPRARINETAQELLYDSSLLPELDRIYEVKNRSGRLYHPVHYIVRSDNDEDYREIINALICALYENGRLLSRQYCELSITAYGRGERGNTFDLYRAKRGGAVVVKMDPERYNESLFGVNASCAYIERLSKVINRFHADVLTVFVLPTVCERETEAIYRNTDAVFIEIAPENARGDTAVRYLGIKAKKAGLTPAESLFKGIDSERAYTAGELSKHFAAWYSDHVRTKMYPQYSGIKNERIKFSDSRFGRALKELDEMIGLDEAKRIIYNALDFYKMRKIYKQFGKKPASPSMHMVFTGNPGTAKTTVARLFAQILKDNGVIKNGQLIEAGRADLIGKYVGHTAPRVVSAFDSARGGVLFIDEAYSLLDDRRGMFGDEALSTIVQEMENRRDETIVIFAGYPKETAELLDSNPGLRSRIAFHVPFNDYSPKELVDITRLMAHKGDNVITPEVSLRLYRVFEAAVGGVNFGNGRFARNTLERAELNRASRLAAADPEDITEDMLRIFLPEDFEICPAPSKCAVGFLN